jgi:hypothetical protein
MALVYSILIVAAAFIFFAAVSYILVRTTFPKIENDDWEERYVEIKRNTDRLTQVRKRALSSKSRQLV